MEEFVRPFMGEDDQLFGWREAVEDLNASAERCTKRAAQIVNGFDGNATSDDRRAQCRGLAAVITRRLGRLRERLTIR
jgi:hypothetical protein